MTNTALPTTTQCAVSVGGSGGLSWGQCATCARRRVRRPRRNVGEGGGERHNPALSDFRGSYPPPTAYATGTPRLHRSVSGTSRPNVGFRWLGQGCHAGLPRCRHVHDMHPATRALQETIIRAIRMMLAAWERWLKDRQSDEPTDPEHLHDRPK